MGAEEMPQWVRGLSCEFGDLGLNLQSPCKAECGRLHLQLQGSYADRRRRQETPRKREGLLAWCALQQKRDTLSQTRWEGRTPVFHMCRIAMHTPIQTCTHARTRARTRARTGKEFQAGSNSFLPPTIMGPESHQIITDASFVLSKHPGWPSSPHSV